MPDFRGFFHMNNEPLHRKATFGHSLCGQRVSPENCTLEDSEVTCEACLKILDQITFSDTKTKTLSRFKYQDKNKKG